MNNDQTTPSNNDANQADLSNPQPGLVLGTNPAGQPMSASPGSDATDTSISAPSAPDSISEPGTSVSPTSNSGSVDPELNDIRKDALTKLTPLVGKLDQPPEERFHTLMMVIQASDNQALIKEAYEAANQIEDETKKAEALLGIVNEINYFSKKDSTSGE